MIRPEQIKHAGDTLLSQRPCRASVLTTDWRFRRSPVAQCFTSSASSPWCLQTADVELQFSRSMSLEGEIRGLRGQDIKWSRAQQEEDYRNDGEGG